MSASGYRLSASGCRLSASRCYCLLDSTPECKRVQAPSAPGFYRSCASRRTMGSGRNRLRLPAWFRGELCMPPPAAIPQPSATQWLSNLRTFRTFGLLGPSTLTPQACSWAIPQPSAAKRLSPLEQSEHNLSTQPAAKPRPFFIYICGGAATTPSEPGPRSGPIDDIIKEINSISKKGGNPC